MESLEKLLSFSFIIALVVLILFFSLQPGLNPELVTIRCGGLFFGLSAKTSFFLSCHVLFFMGGLIIWQCMVETDGEWRRIGNSLIPRWVCVLIGVLIIVVGLKMFMYVKTLPYNPSIIERFLIK